VRWSEFVARQRAAHSDDRLAPGARASSGGGPRALLVIAALGLLAWIVVTLPGLAGPAVLIALALAIAYVLRQVGRPS
jgi:hypothetical protein